MNGKVILMSVLAMAMALLVGSSCKPEYPKCENDDHCKEQKEFCVHGMCQKCRSASDCAPCQQCAAGSCQAIPNCCQGDADCAAGQKCRSGQCGPQCLAAGECGAKEICQGGRCVPVACVGDQDCPAGQTCSDNQCITVKHECSLDKIHFDFDQAAIRSDARPILEANASCLKEKGKVNIVIEGHCDERGTEEYNLALGERRARAAKEFLQRMGFGGKARTVSYGENRPIANGTDEGSYSENRRDEFKIE